MASQTILPEGETARRPARQPLPVLRLGFRPFYWSAALFAALTVPLWVALYLGAPIAGPRAVPEYLWHAHEMVFGFGMAVVVGFLFTAVRNWTGKDTPSGTPLAMLVLLWGAARVLAWTGPTWAMALASAGFLLVLLWGAARALAWTGPLWAMALASAGFLLAAAMAVARVLVAARNRRNYFVALLLLGFAVLDAAFFASASGLLPLSPLAPVRTAILLLVFLVAVIGGRVIPMFTQNATGVQIVRNPTLDRAALGTLLGAVLAYGLRSPALVVAVLWFAASAANLARLLSWRPWVSRGKPILWILHVAYAWIPLGLALMGLAHLGWFSAILALHALTVGAVGGMISGMITRTALGHTGRMLAAGTGETAFYLLVLAAAIVRVGGPLISVQLHPLWLVASAAMWSGAFLTYLVAYSPILWRSRADGLPG